MLSLLLLLWSCSSTKKEVIEESFLKFDNIVLSKGIDKTKDKPTPLNVINFQGVFHLMLQREERRELL